MKELHAIDRSIRQILANQKYQIDYYQREYRWETKQVNELLDDLTTQFHDAYDSHHTRTNVRNYGRYFLGPIIISDTPEGQYIIDGQQRLTTLTLLLLALNTRLRTMGTLSQLDTLIFSEQYGEQSFNLDVDERQAVMEALFQGKQYEIRPTDTDSVKNLVARYEDIEQINTHLDDHSVPFFKDWLIDNVYLVAITATTESDAYTIFETMNDRGLSLSPTEMLKGYLLTNLDDGDSRHRANKQWRERLSALTDIGKEEDADAVRAWLRAQHAKTLGQRTQGAEPGDFERIGGEFHRWVREQSSAIGLKSTEDFHDFVFDEAAYFQTQYLELRRAAGQVTPGLEAVRYLEVHNFTLQYPVLLAPLRVGDSDELISRKWRIVGAFLDVMLHRRLWNQRSIGQSTMRSQMYSLIRDIRHRDPENLADILHKRLDSDTESFSANPTYGLHGRNERHIRRILARLTDYIENNSGKVSHFDELLVTGAKGFDIEHILNDSYEGHEEDFANEAEYWDHRGWLGGLLLLPRSVNRSLQDLSYSLKLPKYGQENLLAASLYGTTYENNPQFEKFISENDLQFTNHVSFGRNELERRQALYIELANLVWSPDRIEKELTR